MNSKSGILPIGVLVLALTHSALVWGDESESFTNYESIVNQLKGSVDDTPPPPPQDDMSWDEVALHGGLALLTSYVSITAPNGAQGGGLLKGIEFNFGINLFSRYARAEGAFRNYRQETLDRDLLADLKEFELRFLYLPKLNAKSTLRTGVGLAARYLDLNARSSQNGWSSYTASTPASIFLVGVEHKLSPNVAVGPDVMYRSALIGETYDKYSLDASFRLNATF